MSESMQAHDSHRYLRLPAVPVVVFGVVIIFNASVILFPILFIGLIVAIAVAAIWEYQGRSRAGLWIVVASWAWIVLVVPTFGIMPMLIAARLQFHLLLGNTLTIFTGFTLTGLYDVVTGTDSGGTVDHPFPPLTHAELYAMGSIAIGSCAVPARYLLSLRRSAVTSAPSN